MPPRVMTRSAGRPAAASRGGETGRRAGRGGGRTRGRSGDQDFKTLTREEFFPSNAMQKLETELWNHAMVRDSHAAYTDRFHELSRLVPHLVTPKGKRIERGEPSKDRNEKEDNKRTRTGNAFATTINPVGRENTGGNRPNQALAINGGQGHGNQGNQVRGRAFMLGAEEARQDPNIITSIEPSDLGFNYETKIASGQLVEIDKAEIICREKVVRIPLLVGKVLLVLGEKQEEKLRRLMSAKARENKLEEVVVVRDFLEVFLDDISGLSPVREIKFQIELIPRAMPVAKSPYRWHLLNWRSCRDNSRNSKKKVSFDQAYRLREHCNTPKI
nr:putative reverse transcriptase domain-containing protein [Tanacetum cinerariifolium]